MNLIEQFGKKKVLIIAGGAITLAILAGIGVWYVNEQNHKEEVLASIDLTFKEDVFIEYGQEKVNYNEYIKEKVGEPEVILPTNEIDTKTLAKHEVTYQVVKEGYSKDANLTLEVKDTKAPEIVVKEDIVTIEFDAEYDIKDNVESVKDPVDGDIPYSKSDEENNYYTVEGTVDKSTSGDYTITIKAVDKNKQVSKKTYTVHVNEKQTEEPSDSKSGSTSENSSGGSSIYTPPTNNGGNGGSYTPPSNDSGGSSSGGSTTPPPTTCSANGQWKSLGNSGYASYDYNTALQWGKDNCPNNNRVVVATVHDICGNEGYSVGFYPLTQ